jgi:hypothetical protein
VWLAPALPPDLARLSIEKFSLAGEKVSIQAAAGRVDISGLPPDLHVIHEPEPLPAAVPGKEGHP